MAKSHNSQIIHRRYCPICGSSDIRNFVPEYKKCSYCKGAFVEKMNQSSDIYEDEYYFYSDQRKNENLKRADYQVQYLMRLSKKLNSDFKKIKILDIGCGTGEFVFRCLENGLDAYGADFSEKAIETAIMRYPVSDRVFTSRVEDMPDASYGVITLWEVVEHLEKPMELLQEALRLLQVGGTLLLSTPNVGSLWVKLLKSKWHGFGIPQYHVTYFSPVSMEIALKKQLAVEHYEIDTVSPYNNYLFLTKNVLGSIVPNIQHDLTRKLMKGILLPIVFIPNKLLEFFAAKRLSGDTLIIHAVKKA